VRAKGQTRPTRTFWWDRELRTDADVLRAVIFDADSALARIEHDGDVAARTELIDAVMSLFVAGVWVSVVSAGPRRQVEMGITPRAALAVVGPEAGGAASAAAAGLPAVVVDQPLSAPNCQQAHRRWWIRQPGE
jgi:hypothetical protein